MALRFRQSSRPLGRAQLTRETGRISGPGSRHRRNSSTRQIPATAASKRLRTCPATLCGAELSMACIEAAGAIALTSPPATNRPQDGVAGQHRARAWLDFDGLPGHLGVAGPKGQIRASSRHPAFSAWSRRRRSRSRRQSCFRPPRRGVRMSCRCSAPQSHQTVRWSLMADSRTLQE